MLAKKTNKNKKFNELLRLFSDVAYGDRDKLIVHLIDNKHSTFQELGDVLDVSKQNIQQVYKSQKAKHEQV